MNKNCILSILILFFLVQNISAQNEYYLDHTFTQADTLRGQLRPERTCYDVHFYELDVKVDIENKSIGGRVIMNFEVLEETNRIQIDLFENMKVNSIYWPYSNKKLNYKRIHNAIFVETPTFKKGTKQAIVVEYEGKPIIANNPPWDGGFVWKKDRKGNPWIGVACEGIGASLWWPNKDHLSDEPDSMSIKVAVPDPLMCVANGNLRDKKQLKDGYTRYDWFVSYPINNYNVTVNIANYEHFADTYTSPDGSELALDYYVLPQNLAKAKKQFQQVPEMLACFENYFDKYPFWNDGFALIETPYLGMEHQSAIAYGNRYMRGYLGTMIPKDMDWDYIIIHETGHEYWGNSISCNDLAEMWIHESFTTYMEALYVECRYSYDDATRYLLTQRPFIQNDCPVVGPKDVNFEHFCGSDHYYKGAWILHTLRHAIGDDDLFFGILKSFYQEHEISNINSEDFFNYVNRKTGQNWDAFFEQYLYHPKVPRLVYRLQQVGADTHLSCRWETEATNFKMPILVGNPDNYQRIQPSSAKKIDIVLKNLDVKDFQIAEEYFYIESKMIR